MKQKEVNRWDSIFFFNTYVEVDYYDLYKDKKFYSEEEKKRIKIENEGKKINVYNNEGIINIENWENKKDIFFSQRMEKYNQFLTEKEKINLELDYLDKLPILNDLFKVLISRYKEYLKNKEPQQTLKNEYPKIFKNDIGFTIFTEMYSLYKNEENHLANFSFLFHAMEKEYLVCSQIDFVKFLSTENHNIHIDKIDSRQSGKSKKTLLYNSIREKINKSTKKAQ